MAKNQEDKGGVARTTRVQTPRVLLARFVAGRSFRNLGYRTPINPSRDRCQCDLHDHEADIGVGPELILFEQTGDEDVFGIIIRKNDSFAIAKLCLKIG